jgi:hypothetical protein
MEASADSIEKWLIEATTEVSKLKKQSDELRKRTQESSGQIKLDLEKAASDIDVRLVGLRIELVRWRFKLEKALHRQHLKHQSGTPHIH